MGARVHHVDWLRVLVVLLLFPFHVSRVFNAGEPWYIKGPEAAAWLNPALAFVDRWNISVLFVLAGAATCLALRKRSTGQYVLERVKRLLVPLVFGFFVLIPPQTWLGARFHSGLGADMSFLEYLTSGTIFTFNLGPGGDYYGGFGIGHLWFVLFLFLVSIIVVPMLWWTRREKPAQRMSRWATRLANPISWLVVALVLWFAEGLPELGGENLFYNTTLFVLGYIAMQDESFAKSAERSRWPALAVGSAITLAYVLTPQLRDALPDPSWSLFGVNLAGQLGVWLVIVGLLGVGRRYLDRPSAALSYLSESSYPVYILHQTVIVVLAWYVIRMTAPWPLQWIVLFVGAVAITFALYEVVRRVPPLRFLFGMRPAPRPVPVPEPTPA